MTHSNMLILLTGEGTLKLGSLDGSPFPENNGITFVATSLILMEEGIFVHHIILTVIETSQISLI